MKTKCLILFLIVSCCLVKKGWTQDPEFSQFYTAPYHLNPSMIGFTSEPRVTVNYRHQYPSFNNAWLTMGIAYDQHFEELNSSFGLSVLADRAGGIYNTYLVSGQYAYQLQLNDKLLLKAGAQVSYLQKNLNWDKVVLPDMIDDTTGDIIPGSFAGLQETNNIHRLDLGLGMVAYTDQLYIGASFKHITRPSVSFTTAEDPENSLHVRSAFHLGYVFYTSKPRRGFKRFYISPNVLFVNQGPVNQINAGAYLGKGALFGGVWARHTFNNMDALIFMAGVKAGVFRFGYSYDYRLGSLGVNANAHEVSMTFDFGQTYWAKKRKKVNADSKCPEIFE